MLHRLRQLDIPTFNRVCTIFGLAYLLIAVGKSVWYEYKQLPQTADYPQYFMGGVIARHGAWDSMYPIPNPGSRTNPGFVGNSELRPGYRALADRYGVAEACVRYMQPPLLTLVLIPLTLLPLKLSHAVWMLLLILATVEIARQGGKGLELCLGRPTCMLGVLVVLVCLSPSALRWVRASNMSPLIAWCIGYSVLELIRRDGPRGASAMALGAIAKYALLVLGPLQIAMRRWRTIAWEIGITAAWCAISLAIMGTGPFRTFAKEIAPTLGRTSTVGENSAIFAFIMRVQNIDDDTKLSSTTINAFRAAEFATLALILGLILLRKPAYWMKPDRVLAAAAALVCWLLLFSPIFWEHYQAYLVPFWGWLAYEALRSRTRAVIAGASIVLAYMPTSILLSQLHLPKLPEPFFSHLMWSTVLMLVLAVDRLMRDRTSHENAAT